jgi:hypothetical protein
MAAWLMAPSRAGDDAFHPPSLPAPIEARGRVLALSPQLTTEPNTAIINGFQDSRTVRKSNVYAIVRAATWRRADIPISLDRKSI